MIAGTHVELNCSYWDKEGQCFATAGFRSSQDIVALQGQADALPLDVRQFDIVVFRQTLQGDPRQGQIAELCRFRNVYLQFRIAISFVYLRIVTLCVLTVLYLDRRRSITSLSGICFFFT